MSHDRCAIVSPTVFFATLLLALAVLLPDRARADPILGADAFSTFEFVGSSCTSTPLIPLPSNLPQSASLLCTDSLGDKLEADAHASAGSVGALAAVTAIPCLSSSDCGANAIANASSTTTFIFTASSDVTFTTGNVTISGTSTATPNSAADFLGIETVDGQETVRCIDTGSTGRDPGPICTRTPVAVRANVPVTVTIALQAGAEANAGFNSSPQIGTANAFDTFAFPIGSDVFDVDAGVTVNSPDAFVFDNRYLPSDATAVPEPASGLLLIMGLIALGALRGVRTSAM